MSVVVTFRVPGDTARFRQFVEENPDTLSKIAETARAHGCIHHRFGVGDGEVIVIDEWESRDAFLGFFDGNPDIEAVMRDAGAQGAPEITFSEAIRSADEF